MAAFWNSSMRLLEKAGTQERHGRNSQERPNRNWPTRGVEGQRKIGCDRGDEWPTKPAHIAVLIGSDFIAEAKNVTGSFNPYFAASSSFFCSGMSDWSFSQDAGKDVGKVFLIRRPESRSPVKKSKSRCASGLPRRFSSFADRSLLPLSFNMIEYPEFLSARAKAIVAHNSSRIPDCL